jgi:RHS repeat-associated protein
MQITQINVGMNYTNPEFLPKLAEWHVYGNEQQGRFLTKYPEELNPTFYGTEVTLDVQNNIFKRQLGKKSYELKDHLGNVRVTHSDIKMPTGTPAQPFRVDLLSKSEYYPYGMKIDDLSYQTANSRFSYNSQEKDVELNKNMLSAEFWEYDARSARRWNQDPKPFANFSNYSTFQNNPIKFSDPLGDIVEVEGELTGDIQGPQTEFATIQRDNLNTLQKDAKGKIIYDELHASNTVYSVTSEVSLTGAAAVSGLKMLAGNLSNSKSDFPVFGHEMFHWYQQENGQGNISIETEVEAYLFTYHLTKSIYNANIKTADINSNCGSEFKTSFLKTYNDSEFDLSNFHETVDLFQSGSIWNQDGIYNNFVSDKNFKPVLYKLYPLSQGGTK